MGAKDVTTLTEGDELEPFVRRAELGNFNRYAAVNDEFIDFHMDDAAAIEKGFPRAIGMGNLTFAWMHCLLRDAFEGRARILHMASEFRTPVFRDDTVTCRGVVTARKDEPDGPVYELEIWAENEAGERLTKATARVAVAATAD